MCRTGSWIGRRRLRWNLAPLPNGGVSGEDDGKRSSVGGSIAIVSDGPRRKDEGGEGRLGRPERNGRGLTPGMVSGRSGRPLARRASRPTGRLARSPPRCLLSGAARCGAADFRDRRSGRASARAARDTGTGAGGARGRGSPRSRLRGLRCRAGASGGGGHPIASLHRSSCRGRVLRHHGGRRLRVTHGQSSIWRLASRAFRHPFFSRTVTF